MEMLSQKSYFLPVRYFSLVGFTGNMVMKTSEGVAALGATLKEEIAKNIWG